MLVSILFFTIIIYILYHVFKLVNYWKDNGVAQYNQFNVWKNTFSDILMLKHMAENIKTVYDSFDGFRYCGAYDLLKKVLVIRDPELIKQITVKDFDHFIDHLQFTPEDVDPLWEKNLFSLKGNKWKHMRTVLSPSFTSSKMKMMFNLIEDCTKLYVKYFEDVTRNGNIVTEEMKDVFSRFANDVIASTAFGVTCNSIKIRDNIFFLKGKELVKLEGLLINLKLIFMFIAPTVAKFFGMSFLPADAKSFFIKIIRNTVKIRKKREIIRPDMLYLLMEASKSKEMEKEFTIENITAQALIFFFAGFDTVSTLMCFMAHELAVNPEIQKRLQIEVDETLDKCNGSVTYDALCKMNYMEMVESETLRKWPPTVLIDRVCTEAYTITPIHDGERAVHIKKGDTIRIPIYGLHRDPLYFPNPECFDPERFSAENTITGYSYLPFGSGPRACIANRFALMETKLIFFYLLQKFNFVVVDKTQMPLQLLNTSFQLTPKGGFWLGVSRRNLLKCY